MNQKSIKKGIYFAIIAAVTSGFAVFVSAFATKIVKEPFVLTTARNLIVMIWFSAILIGLAKWVSLKKLTAKQWLQLFLIGVIGGSIPFLLFFQGLSLSSAANGAFIQKTLFIWVSLLAVVFLKEKLGIWQFFALAILLIGNYFLGGPKSWIFGRGELLIFIATLFWALEMIIAKIALEKLPSIIVAWGRMFFGSLIMILFLAITHRLSVFASFNLHQWLWIVLPSLLLFAYVGFWYAGLKYAPASLVTSVLVIASPITTLLTSIFFNHQFKIEQVFASLIVSIGVIIFIKYLPKVKDVGKRKFAIR